MVSGLACRFASRTSIIKEGSLCPDGLCVVYQVQLLKHGGQNLLYRRVVQLFNFTDRIVVLAGEVLVLGSHREGGLRLGGAGHGGRGDALGLDGVSSGIHCPLYESLLRLPSADCLPVMCWAS